MDHRDDYSVPKPLRVGSMKKQFFKMLKGWIDHPKRVPRVRKQLSIGFDCCDGHPEKGKQ